MILALSLWACAPEEEDDGPPPDLDSGAEADCNEHAPVIDEVRGEPGDPVKNEEQEEQAAIEIAIHVTDADEDLSQGHLEAWFETPPDGQVDGSAEPMITTQTQEFKDVETYGICSSGDLSITFSLGVTGSQLKFDTTYDIGIVFYDAHDTPSELFVGEGLTPSPI